LELGRVLFVNNIYFSNVLIILIQIGFHGVVCEKL
jgi:hypothetical protein